MGCSFSQFNLTFSLFFFLQMQTPILCIITFLYRPGDFVSCHAGIEEENLFLFKKPITLMQLPLSLQFLLKRELQNMLNYLAVWRDFYVNHVTQKQIIGTLSSYA